MSLISVHHPNRVYTCALVYGGEGQDGDGDGCRRRRRRRRVQRTYRGKAENGVSPSGQWLRRAVAIGHYGISGSHRRDAAGNVNFTVTVTAFRTL